ncbi:hypothetical protein A3H38_03335 [candidate division WOR-1 bacterium RIFCSPLOWO2_02_FULL_46_20]|uniref:Uncharacterized protein n=2 Tax=Saganbacteria TaxID=1703751 RepID=A0A1F4RGB6_UNCSA|nr:MAG: hypothetical protein A3J44_06960 [candidate division WOR-1 bacterium RIFCSPHIGHO2_02_FULL_45_12]OGC07222.1 MAG: hypothetical protein A3H38_03335 [candidate division WOR-1 bacterium RIFCSPLOWO2_02_FULL_46_20]OGC10002.1 MAG: hypothetical protein A3F86_03735 [candidate division WOR-1 bacterium RIFCSPLOWO2_12_FULL_45_9]
MLKKLLSGVLLFLVVLMIPVEGRELFLQTKEQSVANETRDVSASYPLQSFKLKYIKASDFAEMIVDLLGKGEGVALNKTLNAVMVRASHDSIKRLTAQVEKLDVPPLQVQVEARVIELKANDGDTTNPSALGASWTIRNSSGSNDYLQLLTTDTVSAAATSMGLFAQLMTGNVEAYLTALQKTVGYNLVASPWITAINHEEAEILIGSKYGYMTTLTTTTGTMQNIEFLEVGTKLKFTPHINEDGYIIMEIYPSVSEGSVTNSLPQENTTETKNKVLVKDGQSVVIGGLSKKYDQQTEIAVPILSNIPLLGNLFKRTEIVSEKRELMVVVTPHIVTPAFLEVMAGRAKELEKSRQEWSENVKLLR